MAAEIAVVSASDYDDLAAFLASFPAVRPASSASWLECLRAWWDRNPAFDESLPRGWVVRDAGRIGGFFGLLPLKFQVGEDERQAFGALHWYVLPAYRGRSLALRLRALDTQKHAIHFSTTPKPDRLPLLKRLGYQPIPRGPGTELQSHFILDGRKFFAGPARNPMLRGAGAVVAAPLLSALQGLRTRELARAADADVRDLARADAAFDDLWQRTRRRYANTNIRTAQLLNWYCFSIQPSDKKLLGFYEGGVLLGYMVLWLKREPTRQVIECVDVWIDPAAGEARVLAALVAAAVRCARDAGFERVIFPHFTTTTAALYRRLGLLQGPRWTRREFFKAPPDLAGQIGVENSYFVWAQGEYGLSPKRDGIPAREAGAEHRSAQRG